MWSLFVALAFAEPRVHVRDLPPSPLPASLSYDPVRERLVVDGVPVRGSRAAQLEWLRAAFDDAPSLRIDERVDALRRRDAAAAVVTGASAAAVATMVVLPPSAVVLVPLGLGTAAIDAVGAAVSLSARDRMALRDLAEEVAVLQAVDRGLASR